MNINNIPQGDLIRDFAEVWLKASAVRVGEAFARELLGNKPRWPAGYDPVKDEYWCIPETTAGTTAIWPKPNGPRVNASVLSWRYGEFQAYRRQREKEMGQ